jgi:hypothetical protein
MDGLIAGYLTILQQWLFAVDWQDRMTVFSELEGIKDELV